MKLPGVKDGHPKRKNAEWLKQEPLQSVLCFIAFFCCLDKMRGRKKGT